MLNNLRNALRPFACKWDGCSAVLASWTLLVKHTQKLHTPTRSQETYECCIKESPRGRPCNTAFDSYEGLSDHLLTTHLNKLLYQCPIKGCRVNLRRFNDHEDMEAHLEEHLPAGSSLPKAIAQAVPDAHTPFPPEIQGDKPSFQLVALSFPPPTFSPHSLAKARQRATSSSDDTNLLLFGQGIREEWLEEEEEDDPVDTKERKLKSEVYVSVQPAKTRPKLEIPPRLLAAPPPRHSEVSVGFHSQGFGSQAQAAFEKVALDMDMDEEDEDEDEQMGSLFS